MFVSPEVLKATETCPEFPARLPTIAPTLNPLKPHWLALSLPLREEKGGRANGRTTEHLLEPVPHVRQAGDEPQSTAQDRETHHCVHPVPVHRPAGRKLDRGQKEVTPHGTAQEPGSAGGLRLRVRRSRHHRAEVQGRRRHREGAR